MQLQLVEGWLLRWVITVAVLFLRHRPMQWQGQKERQSQSQSRSQEAAGCIFSCAALANAFFYRILCCFLFKNGWVDCWCWVGAFGGVGGVGAGSAHLLFKMVAMHFDFCLFFSLLLWLPALFALSLLFWKKNCSDTREEEKEEKNSIQALTQRMQLYTCKY